MICEKIRRNCYAETDLTFLVNISNTISHSQDIFKDLEFILEELCKFLDAQYSIITIIDRNFDRIMISAAFGLTDEEKSRGVYKIGEGVIGEVVQSMKPMVIKDINKSSKFLNKTGIKKNSNDQAMAFICVPIIVKNEVMGTLSIHKNHKEMVDFSPEVKFLSIVGMLVAKNVSVRRRQIEELEELRKENLRLKNGKSFKPDNIVGNSSLMRDLYD